MVGACTERSALAFEVLLAPMEGDLRLVIDAARGIGLDAPAHVVAARAIGAALGALAARVGSALVVQDVGGKLARAILPDAGARVPATRELRLRVDGALPVQSVVVLGSSDAPPAELGPRVLRALELSELCEEADAHALAGDPEAARRGYLAALERAPRHPAISERLAALDLSLGGRPEAALSTLSESVGAADAGIVGAEALLQCDDPDGAYAALARAASAEPYGALAAMTWLRAAEVTRDPRARRDALDEALVRAPSSIAARWARLESRLALGDAKGARGDAEHLEGAARGPEARHAAAFRAGQLFAARGHAADARARFEKALLYRPDSADAVLGLARALRDLGRGARALDLFARAVALAERAGRPTSEAALELATSLVELTGDRSAAIARVQPIAPDAPEAPAARMCEAKWRFELGDRAGATRALGRLRELGERAIHGDREAARALGVLLVEAAELEQSQLGDLRAAEKDLALALELTPGDREIQRRLRRVAGANEPEIERAPAEGPPPASIARAPVETAEPLDAPEDVERLTDALRANPRDGAIARRLARLLEVLERDLELVALLSARIEEVPEESEALLAERDVVLERIAGRAEADGRADEASLYRSMKSSR